jgi:protein associated with RNAse G/E
MNDAGAYLAARRRVAYNERVIQRNAIPPLPGPPVQVDSRYYPGLLNKRWCSYLLANEPERLVAVRAHGSPVWFGPRDHWWTPPGAALEIYPRDSWFNIFYIFNPAGALDSYYLNIALPPVYSAGRLSFVDLDLDLSANADLTCEVLDEDEFAEHAARWRYPATLQMRARATLDDLLCRVANRDPLFQEWERYWPQVPAAFISGESGVLVPPRNETEAPPEWILPADAR